MSREDIRTVVLAAIREVAPEADVSRIDADERFRNQIDFDSVDYLNFTLALQQKLGVLIPEADFPRLATLSGCVEYLAARLPLTGRE
jgi:acyl carrier protein